MKLDDKTLNILFLLLLHFLKKIPRGAQGAINNNTPMQYKCDFSALKFGNFHMKKCDIFLVFAQNINCGYTIEPLLFSEAVLTSTHNICFRAKNKKMNTPVNPSFTI